VRSSAPPGASSALERAKSLYETGQHTAAESAILDILVSGTPTTDVFRLLALVERVLNKPVGEARALEQALAAIPPEAAATDVVRLWARLGTVRAWLGDQTGALTAYERAAGIAPEDAEALQGIARTQFALHDLEAAQRSAQELERRFPDAAFTHLFAGHVQKALGDVPAAACSYACALASDPLSGEALYNLVDIEAPQLGSDIAARAALVSARNDIPAADRINASFAHARILDAAGRHAEAFSAFQRANDTARIELAGWGVEYVPARVDERVTRVISEYDEASFGSSLHPLPIDLQPVFIVGLPRSGTTLVEQILASHSEVQAAGEILFARECEHTFRQRREAAGRTGPVDPADPIDAESLEAAREQYIERLFERGLDGRWIVDKLPANFEIAGFLRLLFPHAPIVHTIRDPRANCFSLYCANFAAHEAWYHDLGNLAHYHQQYRRLMAHWHKVISPPLIDVAYEHLVRDPRSQIPMLLSAIGLPFEPACLEFYRHQRPILTASHSQVRRPAYTSAVDHWRNYRAWLGPLLDLP
jgi:tetratricopeptide (TPR) repeat protein